MYKVQNIFGRLGTVYEIKEIFFMNLIMSIHVHVGLLLKFQVVGYLRIIPRARMGSESIAHEAEGRMSY